ncbi:MAG: serine/threonine protein kinase [Chloroflexaceae bacterium]|nr:serine/threonine protein kinase [Chloroflexaceae bacterium]
MLARGTLIQNRYEVVQLIGKGGMGAVYEAIDRRLNCTVALKQTLVTEEKLFKAFEHEAQMLANLRHPALTRVSDHFVDSSGQFLVMDFIPGKDLETLLEERGQPFPVDQVLHWSDQILDALDYLHTQPVPIIHRDIKPQNLKLTPRGEVILLDFGLAKGSASPRSRVTSGGSIFGYTPKYAPLEQIQGMGTGPQSDLYALAATLYRLLTNTSPADALSRAASVLNEQPDPLCPAHEVNPQVPPAVSKVLMSAMALGSEGRPTSAASMRQMFQETRSRPASPPPADDQVLKPTVVVPAPGAVALPRSENVPPPEPARKRFSYTPPYTGETVVSPAIPPSIPPATHIPPMPAPPAAVPPRVAPQPATSPRPKRKRYRQNQWCAWVVIGCGVSIGLAIGLFLLFLVIVGSLAA